MTVLAFCKHPGTSNILEHFSCFLLLLLLLLLFQNSLNVHWDFLILLPKYQKPTFDWAEEVIRRAVDGIFIVIILNKSLVKRKKKFRLYPRWLLLLLFQTQGRGNVNYISFTTISNITFFSFIFIWAFTIYMYFFCNNTGKDATLLLLFFLFFWLYRSSAHSFSVVLRFFNEIFWHVGVNLYFFIS